MKKIIRFLARISGVEKDIEIEERKRIGNHIFNEGYTFSFQEKTMFTVQDFGRILNNGDMPNGLDIRKRIFGSHGFY